jgi:hypothetical protein
VSHEREREKEREREREREREDRGLEYTKLRRSVSREVDSRWSRVVVEVKTDD